MDDLDAVADRKPVLHVDLGQAFCVVPHDIADIEAAVRFGMALQVALVLAIRVAFVEAAGIAPVGQAVELAQQGRIERAAGDRVVDGLAIGLAGARHVVGRLGAAFDLERVDADFR